MRLGSALAAADLQRVEQDLHLCRGKWDTQVGDVSILSEQPLIVSGQEWDCLCLSAEQLALETVSLESEILASPEHLQTLGVPKKLQNVLTGARPDGPRTMRFDFHLTSTGWCVSEVNSDVPGGWNEGTALQELYHPYFADLDCPPSPLAAWGEAVATLARGGQVALLSAPGYLEDEQVVRAFGNELSRRGMSVTLICNPAALDWNSSYGCTVRGSGKQVSLIVRFYQLEWLCKLPSESGWKRIVQSSGVPVVNPVVSVISESKRLSLAVQRLPGYPVWKRLLPPCLNPREVDSNNWDEWVLKEAYSNTGDRVYICGQLDAKSRRHVVREARRHGSKWVAQRRFQTLPIQSCRGTAFPCVGMFVVNGVASGAYVRLSSQQVTNAFAVEAPLFIDRRSL